MYFLLNTYKWFWLFFLTYLFLYFMNRMGYTFPDPVQFYLADLFAVPVVATLTMWLTRWTVQKQDFTLPGTLIVFIVLLFILLFELLLPLVMNRYTSDPLDALMYAIGGIFFWKVMNKPDVLNHSITNQV